jgi:hypothetical protein
MGLDTAVAGSGVRTGTAAGGGGLGGGGGGTGSETDVGRRREAGAGVLGAAALGEMAVSRSAAMGTAPFEGDDGGGCVRVQAGGVGGTGTATGPPGGGRGN